MSADIEAFAGRVVEVGSEFLFPEVGHLQDSLVDRHVGDDGLREAKLVDSGRPWTFVVFSLVAVDDGPQTVVF